MSAPVKKCEVTPLEALRRLYEVARKVDASESGDFETLLQGELVVAESVLRDAASPVVPVAAQPVVQQEPKPRMLSDMVAEWEAHQLISDIPAVDEALRDFSDDPTGDNAVYIVREVLKAAAPSLEAQPAGEVEKPGMLKAADIIGEKAKDYLNEFATTEHDTGAVVFLYGQDGCDYYTSLVELSEEIRSIAIAQGEKNEQ